MIVLLSWIALAQGVDADAEVDACMDRLAHGAHDVRGLKGCVAWAHRNELRACDAELLASEGDGASPRCWTTEEGTRLLARHREAWTAPLQATIDETRQTARCIDLGTRHRGVEVCGLIDGLRVVPVHDERDLVTAATSAVDVAMLRVPEAAAPLQWLPHGEAVLVGGHPSYDRDVAYRAVIACRDGTGSLGAGDHLASVEGLTLGRDTQGRRLWEIALVPLSCAGAP